jgi:undecaprenyl-diphosphatase
MRPLLAAIMSRLEAVYLVLWLLAAGAVWGFFNIASEVREGDTLVLDRRLLLLLRRPGDPSDPIGPRWLEEAMRDVTALGGFTVLTFLVIVVVCALLFHRKWRQAATFSGVAIMSQVSSAFLKEVYDRPRPDLVPHGSYVYSASFPSGHSVQSAAVYLMLATVISSLETTARTKALAFGVAGLIIVGVGFSRVYLGVHWPSDVLAGWSLGAAWALLGWLLLRLLVARSKPGQGTQIGNP